MLAGVAVLALVAASFVLPGVLGKGSRASEASIAKKLGVRAGTGLPAGSAVPTFTEKDVVSGRPITSATLYGHETLLFFSEGVMCQACFEQIQGLQRVGSELRDHGIQLVSVTPDPPAELEQAIRAYGITTPMISDADRTMSVAFNTLGLGMHGDTPGHSFALIDRGKVLWYRDYYLPPYRTMYVDPKRLLTDILAA